MGTGGWRGCPCSLLLPPSRALPAHSQPNLPVQVSAVCQHVCRVSPRGEGALRLVPGLQPRRAPAAHHEVAGDQLPLPRRVWPPLRVHLSPLRVHLSPGGAGGAEQAACPARYPPGTGLAVFICVNKGSGCAPCPAVFYWIKTNQQLNRAMAPVFASPGCSGPRDGPGPAVSPVSPCCCPL